MAIIVVGLLAIMGAMIYVSMNPTEIEYDENIYYTVNEFTVSDILRIDGELIEKTNELFISNGFDEWELKVSGNEDKFVWITLDMTIKTESVQMTSCCFYGIGLYIYAKSTSANAFGPVYCASFDAAPMDIERNVSTQLKCHYLVPIPYEEWSHPISAMNPVTFNRLFQYVNWIPMN